MNYKHLKFELPIYSRNYLDNKTITSKIFSFISRLLAKSNPGFEKIYTNIDTWLIEFNEKLEVTREIGLDKNRNVIAVGPYENNRGFWTDSNLKYQDIENCFDKNDIISPEDFENTWGKFSKI